MNTKRIRKLATVAATAALAVQLFAGTASAAVPNASSNGGSYNHAGDGDAGFFAEYHFADNNLSKLFLDITIDNSASLSSLTITKEGAALSTKASCSVATATDIQCLFKSVKNGDDFRVEFAVTPLAAGPVTATGAWSSTGFVLGDNSSHGDSWDIADSATDDNTLVSAFSDDPDLSEGFGNTTLSTQASTNKQSAKLLGLPPGKFASIDDNAGDDGFGFSILELTVNDHQDWKFQLVVTYPKGTSAPKSFSHSTNPDPVLPCVKGSTGECFTWSNKNNTVTFQLLRNGSLRRTS